MILRGTYLSELTRQQQTWAKKVCPEPIKHPQKPDVLPIVGQGLAHPRRFGLACHVGVELDWPTRS